MGCLAADDDERPKLKLLLGFSFLSTMPWRRIGEWRHRSTIHNLGTRCRWMVSFTPRPLYSLRRENPRYPLKRRLGGDIMEKRNLPLQGIELRFLGSPARNLVTIPTELFRLHPWIELIIIIHGLVLLLCLWCPLILTSVSKSCSGVPRS
jgi:hypothetical protein